MGLDAEKKMRGKTAWFWGFSGFWGLRGDLGFESGFLGLKGGFWGLKGDFWCSSGIFAEIFGAKK